MELKELAHLRTGDKGNISIISIISYKKENYDYLLENITEQRVKDYFSNIVHGKVTRYTIPSLKALNFVMEDALGGGVTRSLSMDMHGKTLGSLLEEIEI